MGGYDYSQQPRAGFPEKGCVHMPVTVIITASGSGLRMGGDVPKQFMLLGGRPVIAHAIDVFNRTGIVSKIVVTAPQKHINQVWEIAQAYGFDKVKAVTAGGDSRAKSVYAALKELSLMGCGSQDVVLVHDGVRPFVSEELVKTVAAASEVHGAAIAGTPLTDTLKEVNKQHRVTSTLDRSLYWRVQTPQGFTYDILQKAYAQGEKDGMLAQATDDSMLAERLGIMVTMVEGDPYNIKITSPADMIVAEALLRK